MESFPESWRPRTKGSRDLLFQMENDYLKGRGGYLRAQAQLQNMLPHLRGGLLSGGAQSGSGWLVIASNITKGKTQFGETVKCF